MKRTVFSALLLLTVMLLLPTLALAGCEDLSAGSAGDTSSTESTAPASLVTSTSGQTAGASTTTTAKSAPKATTTTASYGSLEVLGTLQQFHVLTRYEENDPHLTWSGGWQFDPNDMYSGGNLAWTKETGASVTIKFSGTSIALVCLRGKTEGTARLTLDGGIGVTAVDFYSAINDSHPVVIWQSGTLADEKHTLKVECIHTKNPAASDYWIGVDAFDVFGNIE